MQVVFSTNILKFIPVFVKNEDQYFKKSDKFNKPKTKKLDCVSE